MGTTDAARGAAATMERLPKDAKENAAGWIGEHAAEDARVAGAFVAGVLCALDPEEEPPAPLAFHRTETEPEGTPEPAGLATIEEAVEWCRARELRDAESETSSNAYSAGSYSTEHETGCVWVWFDRVPPRATREAIKAAGFEGVYEGHYITKKGTRRPNFAGWRFEPAAAEEAA